MVNRVSHHPGGDSDVAAASSEHEELTKLSRDEVLSMLTFGASRIFKATGADQRDEDIDAILKRSMDKAEATKEEKQRATADKRAPTAAGQTPSLLGDEREVIASELEVLKELHHGATPMEVDPAEHTSSEGAAAGGGAAAAGALSSSVVPSPRTPSHSAAIIDGAQLSARDILFDGRGEREVTQFEGIDHAAGKKVGIKARFDQRPDELIMQAGVKRERKPRLITVQDARGREFTILASQQNDLTIEDQKMAGKGKRSRGKQPAATPPTPAALVESPPAAAADSGEDGSARSARRKSRGDSSVGAISSALTEPVVVGADYAIDWQKSEMKTGKDLERAVKALNALDAKGDDITESRHKVSLWIRKTDRWNVSTEEKAEWDRQSLEAQKAEVALRNAKRRRWADGAPEEAWLGEEMAQKKQPGRQPAAKAADGYVDNGRYTHEDWCHLCKIGGELLCCGYCPRTYHRACLGMASRSAGGQFSCPQHKCAKCERSSAEAGGMLFRCTVCPCSYCEDDVPTEYEGQTHTDERGHTSPAAAVLLLLGSGPYVALVPDHRALSVLSSFPC